MESAKAVAETAGKDPRVLSPEACVLRNILEPLSGLRVVEMSGIGPGDDK